jgi:hypothetical protein
LVCRRQDRRIRLPGGRTVWNKDQYRTSTDNAEDRIPQEKGLLRRIQEPEYRTEKRKSLI